MSGSELSSTYSETLVRVQAKCYVRIAPAAGGPAMLTFIWSADNPDGIIFVIALGAKAETWVFGHDLLKRGMLSHEPIGEGLVTVHTAVNTLRVTMHSPYDPAQWLRVNVALDDVSRVLSAIDSRMLNAPTPDIEAEIRQWMSEGESND